MLAFLLRRERAPSPGRRPVPGPRRAAVSRAGRRIVPRLRSAPGHLELHLDQRPRRDRQGVDLGDPRCSSSSGWRPSGTTAVPRAAWVIQWLILVVLLCGTRLAYRFAKTAARRARAGALRPPTTRDVPVLLYGCRPAGGPVRRRGPLDARDQHAGGRHHRGCGHPARALRARRPGARRARRIWIGSSPSSRSRAFTRSGS